MSTEHNTTPPAPAEHSQGDHSSTNPFTDTAAAATPGSVSPAPVYTTTSEAPAPPLPARPVTPPVAPAQNEDSPPTIPTTDHGPPPDPRIASLLAIFPTFDHAILADVLDSCNGNEEQAVDILLGMTDPEHVPQSRGADIVRCTLLLLRNLLILLLFQSQTELDEQLAHRLMIEEQEAEARQYDQRSNANLPYVPRSSAPRRSGERPRPQDGGLQDQFRDFISPRRSNPTTPPNATPGASAAGTSDLSEQFNRIADSEFLLISFSPTAVTNLPCLAGKKTFNSIFSKVKAKIQEFDGPSPCVASSMRLEGVVLILIYVKDPCSSNRSTHHSNSNTQTNPCGIRSSNMTTGSRLRSSPHNL